jgi:hypothetical protein
VLAEDVLEVAAEAEVVCLRVRRIPPLSPNQEHRRAGSVLPAQYRVRLELTEAESARIAPSRVRLESAGVHRRPRILQLTPVGVVAIGCKWLRVHLKRQRRRRRKVEPCRHAARRLIEAGDLTGVRVLRRWTAAGAMATGRFPGQ